LPINEYADDKDGEWSEAEEKGLGKCVPNVVDDPKR